MTSLGTASSIPHATDGQEAAVTTDPPMRGGEAAPSEIAAAGRLERHRATEEPRRDPQGLVVDSPHLAFMKAHRAWAKRYCPWTLEEWE